MIEQPVLTTSRLVLRPYTLDDAPDLQRLFGVFEVVDPMFNIPWPYAPGMAETWINIHTGHREAGTSVSYAVTRRESEELIGGMGLEISIRNNRAELGYWIGHPFWGQGYAT